MLGLATLSDASLSRPVGALIFEESRAPQAMPGAGISDPLGVKPAALPLRPPQRGSDTPAQGIALEIERDSAAKPQRGEIVEHASMDATVAFIEKTPKIPNCGKGYKRPTHIHIMIVCIPLTGGSP